jgi:predicted CoA-binding protein
MGLTKGMTSTQNPSFIPGQSEAATIAELLGSAKTIAVVGLSSRSCRPSYGVTRYMQAAGYRIFPVNPNEPEILGEKSYARLEDIPEKIDIVNVFRKAKYVPEIVDAAIQIGAHAIWLQEGIIDEPSAAKARAAGLTVVMDRCIFKDHYKRRQ